VAAVCSRAISFFSFWAADSRDFFFSVFFWFSSSFFFPHSCETKIRLLEISTQKRVKRNHATDEAKRARRQKRERGTTPGGGETTSSTTRSFEKRTVEKRERGTRTFGRRREKEEKCTKFSEDDQR